MNSLKSCLTLLFFSILLQMSAQTSWEYLKNSGVKSEDDLKNLGLNESEITQLKADYFKQQENNETTTKEPVNIFSTVENEVQLSKKEIIPQGKIKIYGKSIFKNGYINLKENSDRINPTPNYKLGSGDRLNITIWGASEYSNDFTLDEFGNINPKLVGRINLKGKSLKTAKSIIKSRFSSVYNLSSSNISIDLSFSKVISVNVVGEVNSPGTYSVPSVNSAFNILSLANGVSELGSIRNIEIKRKGKIINTLDVYEFLNSPSQFSHIYLEDGDFIVVKPALGYISFSGEINRRGIYEIKENESLTTLISYAGRFTALADKEAINIVRVENNKLQFNAVSYDYAKKNDLKLRIGDKINILSIGSLVHGFVAITGAVNVPGEYRFEDGDKILDLIKKSKGLNFNSYKKLAHIVRTQDNLYKEIISVDLEEAIAKPNGIANIKLHEFDSVKIFDKNDFLLSQNLSVSGMVQIPGKINYLDGLKVKDVIAQSGGLNHEADLDKIQIERVSFNKKDSSKSYIEIIELSYPKDENFELKPFDHINFRILPEFQFQETIKIDGQVKYPGNYALNGKNEKLSDLIERAGGVTNWSFLEGAKLFRKQDDLGLLLMDLRSALEKENSKFNYILKPGDIITIPKTNDIVSLFGAIGYDALNNDQNKVNTPFHKRKRATFYIKKYGGGYNSKAKKRSVYVIEYNGKVKESIFFGVIKPKVNKGDKIKVDFKPLKPKKEKRKSIDWNRVIESSTIKLTGILTILILASNAFGN